MYNKSIVRTENETQCNPNEMSNPALHDIIATNHVMLTKKAHATALSSACKAAVLMVTFILVAVGIIVLTLVVARSHNNVASAFTKFDAMKPRLISNNSRSGSLDSESLTSVANEQTENENGSPTTVILTSNNLHTLATQNIHMSSSVMGAQENEHISPHTQLMKTYPSLNTIVNEQSTISTTIQTTVYNQQTTLVVDSHHYTDTMTIGIEPKSEKYLTNDNESKAENDQETDTKYKPDQSLPKDVQFTTENDLTTESSLNLENDLTTESSLNLENDLTTESLLNLKNDLRTDTEPTKKEDSPEETKSKIEKDLPQDLKVETENDLTTEAQFKLGNNLVTDSKLKAEHNVLTDTELRTENNIAADSELRTENELTTTTQNQEYIHTASNNPISSIDEDDSILSKDYTNKLSEPTSFTTFLNHHFKIQTSTAFNEHEQAHASDTTVLENNERNTTEDGITDNNLFS